VTVKFPDMNYLDMNTVLVKAKSWSHKCGSSSKQLSNSS